PKGRVSITVKATPNGLVSNWVNSHLRAGMQIRLGRPQGHFCLDGTQATAGAGKAASAKLLFLCAGSGITPCHAIVEDLLRRPKGERPDVQVLAQFRREEDVIFKQALRERWPEA